LQPELLQKYGAKDRLLFTETDYQNLSQCKLLKEILALCHDAQLQRLYALFFIALSEGSLERCENRLMLLRPPHQDFGILRQPYANPVPVEDVAIETEITLQQDLTFNVNGVPFRMKYVEGGSFMMGASGDDSEAFDFEKPAHKVTLDSYYIAETLVTQELWQAVMGSNPSFFKGDIHRPVEAVSWNDCQEFIKKLNRFTGKKFSLPTEAQWEYAARGGMKSKGYKFSGSNSLGDVAWYGEDLGSTHPVAQKQANELGLYDMTGNVWEWCHDWFGTYSSIAQNNPQGLSSGVFRMLRGGSWFSGSRDCRVSCRNGSNPDRRFNYYGLRLSLPV
jgi:formylglycine-generating enzyme required for sulfatase activity